MPWSVRPPEIDLLLDDTPGNEGDGKERGKENCAAGIFRNSSEQNVKFAVQFAHMQGMYFFGPTSTLSCLLVCSVNWSSKTLVEQ